MANVNIDFSGLTMPTVEFIVHDSQYKVFISDMLKTIDKDKFVRKIMELNTEVLIPDVPVEVSYVIQQMKSSLLQLQPEDYLKISDNEILHAFNKVFL